MHDPNSLQKYYKFRKGIQDAVTGVLENFGERREPEARPDRTMRKLQKEIDGVVAEILPDFPELAPLFGRKRPSVGGPGMALDSEVAIVAGGVDDRDDGAGESATGEADEAKTGSDSDNVQPEPAGLSGERASRHEPRRRRPGLMIGFDTETGGDNLAWLRGDTLYINALHPAYRRVHGTGSANLYITFAVATTLSVHNDAVGTC